MRDIMPANSNAMIRLDAVRFSYPGGQDFVFDLVVAAGERVAVIGPSGSGKSTLLHLVAGFERPESGRILFAGVDMTDTKPASRPVSSIFQDNNLFAHLTVAQNAGLGLAPRLRLTMEERTRVAAALEAVGLGDKGGRLPGALSGGERQRVALARALLRERPVLLLDEPFAALGPGLRAEMLERVMQLQAARNLTVVMVSHQIEDARRFASRVLLVDEGRIVDDMAPEALDRPEPGSRLAAYLGLSSKMP